jgi:hypothetical protein
MVRASTSTVIDVAGLQQRQRAADIGFRRDMQDAGAVAGAAHARVGQRTMSRYALLHQLLRDRQHAPFRHARPALRAGIAQHQHVVGVTSRLSSSTAFFIEG